MNQRDKDGFIWNLRSLPNEIEDLIRDLDDETLRWSPIPGKWSVTELICHLRDVERLAFLERYQRLLAEETPVFHELDQNQMAIVGDYKNQDGRSVHADFRRLREQTVAMLEAARADQWERSGIHERLGPINIEGLVMLQKNHDLNHLLQMKDIVRLKMPW